MARKRDPIPAFVERSKEMELIKYIWLVSVLMIGASEASANCELKNALSWNELYKYGKTAIEPKSEFETSKAYATSLEKRIPIHGPITIAIKFAQTDSSYNADASDLKTGVWTLYTRSSGSSLSIDYDGMHIGKRSWDEPSYIGETEFGLKKQVSINHYDTFDVFWKRGPIYLSEGSGWDDIHIKVSPADAAGLKSHLTLIVSGMPEAPYLAGQYFYTPPKIADPTARYAYNRAVIIKPYCLALVDDRNGATFARIQPSSWRLLK